MRDFSLFSVRFSLLIYCCGYALFASAQFKPSDFAFKAQNFVQLNDGFQNINPIVSVDGKQLWFAKINHPSNTGRKDDQDIWHTSYESGEWQVPTNMLTGLNTELNDLIVGTSLNNFIYAMHFKSGSEQGLNEVIAYRIENGAYIEDHVIELPELEFLSEFFGFYVARDESYIIMSLKGEYSFGKEDLYILRKRNDTWIGPDHMGARINTIGFEMSPFVSSDNKHLYFSSEGHNSYGSADIFVSVRLDDTWQNWSRPINLGPNINSEGFEAYFTLNEAFSQAYFVSNSLGQSGAVFSIQYKESNMQESVSTNGSASGFLKNERLPAMNVKLNLLDENDQVVQSVVTNKDGYFNLQAFLPDRDYTIAIDDSIKEMIGDADIYLTNSLGDNMVFMNNPDLGIFGFKVLSGKNVDNLKNLESLASKGKVVDEQTKIMGRVASFGTLTEKVTLNIVDDQNKIVKVIETDDEGFFSFESDAREKSYFLSVDANASGLVDVYEIYLTNDNPNEDIVVTKTDKYLFEFRTLSDGESSRLKRMEEMDNAMPQEIIDRYVLRSRSLRDSEIIGFLRTNKLPMIDAQVRLMDEEDNVLGTVQTDENGRFSFDRQLATGNYKLMLNEDQVADLENSEIFLAKNPTDMVFYLNDERTGVFAFKKLTDERPMTLYSLRTDVEEGAVVASKNTKIKGRFEYSSLPKQGVKLQLLDEKENVIQITDVDADGSFEFENYTVNKNYFISVENGSGLSDIYEIYLSGSNRNVLVNRTDKYVFSFKVLPSLDVMLSGTYAAESSNETALGGVSPVFFEFDLNVLKQTDYRAFNALAEKVRHGENVTIRLFRESAEHEENKVEKETLSEADMLPVIKALEALGVKPTRMRQRQSSSDQVFLYLMPDSFD